MYLVPALLVAQGEPGTVDLLREEAGLDHIHFQWQDIVFLCVLDNFGIGGAFFLVEGILLGNSIDFFVRVVEAAVAGIGV